MGLVFGIEIGAEGLFRLIEYDRQVGRFILWLHLLEQFPKHCAKHPNAAGRQAIRSKIVFFWLVHRLKIGAEDVAGAIHQEQMVALLERARRRISGGGGFGFGFGAGWHGPNVGPDATLINLSCNARTDNAKGLLSPLGTASAMRPPATVAGTTSTSTRAPHARC